MKLQYTSFLVILINFLILGLNENALARNLITEQSTKVVVPPAKPLTEPIGSLATYSGLGAASPGDYTSSDVNPAITSALKKQYLLFANTAWQKHDNLIDFGVFDNTSTDIATIFRVRESIPNDVTPRDRRFTLGLSYQIPKTNLSFGANFDYEQLTLTSLTNHNDYNYFASTGFLYEYLTNSGRPIFIGLGLNKLLDEYNPVEYDLGVSTTLLDGFYSIGADQLFTNINGLEKIAASLSIVANEFMNLKGSYGYLTKKGANFWSAGIFFQGPNLQLFYTFASSETDDTTALRQTAGAALNFVF
jgi:hypothetical protein